MGWKPTHAEGKPHEGRDARRCTRVEVGDANIWRYIGSARLDAATNHFLAAALCTERVFFLSSKPDVGRRLRRDAPPGCYMQFNRCPRKLSMLGTTRDRIFPQNLTGLQELASEGARPNAGPGTVPGQSSTRAATGHPKRDGKASGCADAAGSQVSGRGLKWSFCKYEPTAAELFVSNARQSPKARHLARPPRIMRQNPHLLWRAAWLRGAFADAHIAAILRAWAKFIGSGEASGRRRQIRPTG